MGEDHSRCNPVAEDECAGCNHPEESNHHEGESPERNCRPRASSITSVNTVTASPTHRKDTIYLRVSWAVEPVGESPWPGSLACTWVQVPMTGLSVMKKQKRATRRLACPAADLRDRRSRPRAPLAAGRLRGLFAVHVLYICCTATKSSRRLIQRRYQIRIQKMVRPAGIEPAALRSGAARSVR